MHEARCPVASNIGAWEELESPLVSELTLKYLVQNYQARGEELQQIGDIENFRAWYLYLSSA